MDADTVYCQHGVRRIEVLIFKFVDRPAVNRVAEVAAKAFHVQPVYAVADLLVRREDDAQFAVGRAGGDQLFDGRHDLGDAPTKS